MGSVTVKIEPLTGLEVQAILQYCSTVLDRADADQKQRLKDLHERYQGDEEIHCPAAAQERNEISRLTGWQQGIRHILGVLSTRELPGDPQ
jgi:hypothetical protein